MIVHAQRMDTAWSTIPCHPSLLLDPSLLTQGWRDALLWQRMQCRQRAIMQLLDITKQNWNEAFYITLAHNFGFHTNSMPFEAMALQTPLIYLQKHRNSLFQVTAMLLGQSGLLTEQSAKSEEQKALLSEYRFLQKKFGLQPIDAVMWKRARMRPQNAPERRIRQLAQLLCQSEWLFSEMIHAHSMDKMRELLCLQSDDNDTRVLSPSAIGKRSVDILLINTLLPYRYAYALAHHDEQGVQEVLEWMQRIPAEDNSIIRQWRLIGQQVRSAADTQALIHLYQHYCQNQQCINCEVGKLVFLQ